MRLHPRVIVIGAVSALALALTPGSAVAHDDDRGDRHRGDRHDGRHDDRGRGGHGDLLRSGLVGSTPTAQGGATIFGVAPGGVPWVVDEGSVRVRRDGRLDLRVEGLVIPTPPQNGTNTVPAVTASLYCNAALADATELFPLSIPDGDARIRADLTLPETCVAPVVLLNPNGNAAAYIAATG